MYSAIEIGIFILLGAAILWLLVFVLPKVNAEKKKSKTQEKETITLEELSTNWVHLNRYAQPVFMQESSPTESVFEEPPIENEQSDEDFVRVIYAELEKIINVPDEKGHYQALSQDEYVYIHTNGLKYVAKCLGMDATKEEVEVLRDSLGGASKYVCYIDGKKDKAGQYVRLSVADFGGSLELETRKPEGFAIVLKEK